MTEETINPRPLPQPTLDTEQYWAGALKQQLLVQRCQHCSRYQFYPRAFCTECLSDELEWVQASGQGRIYTFTICRIAPSPAFKKFLPYAAAIVELDEGARMLTNILESDITKVAIGARVTVCFQRVSDDCNLPQFKLVE